jgi:hypothetical protein
MPFRPGLNLLKAAPRFDFFSLDDCTFGIDYEEKP